MPAELVQGTVPIGGVPPGLVQRVQRHLVATGAVATDGANLRMVVAEVLGEDGVHLGPPRLAALVRSIGDELTGLGPLAPLLADPTVTDVMVNGPADVWVERGGAIERAAVRFASAAAVAALVQRVVAPLGLRVDESRPWVDAACRAASGSMRCCLRWPPTARWSPSAPSPGDGSSSAT
jgi:pilus assembly protein CpaF